MPFDHIRLAAAMCAQTGGNHGGTGGVDNNGVGTSINRSAESAPGRNKTTITIAIITAGMLPKTPIPYFAVCIFEIRC
jgi:hypothetical protein